MKAEGKPEHMIEKIVEGKVQAFYKDVALMHQAWVREPKKTIGDLVKEVVGEDGRERPGPPLRSLPARRVRTSARRAPKTRDRAYRCMPT